MKIGEQIRMLRKQKGLTQRELGILSQTGTTTIQQYETGKRTPRIDQLEKISKALHVPLHVLCSGTDISIPAITVIKSALELSDFIFNQKICGRFIPQTTIDSLYRMVEFSGEALSLVESGFNKQTDTEPLANYSNNLQEKLAKIIEEIDTIANDMKIVNKMDRVICDLLTPFTKLNLEGQQVAIQRVEELTEIPKYQRESENSAKKELPPAANRKQPEDE